MTSAGPDGLDRVIRVFISSAFHDMMRRRHLLVEDVFPELRRKCAKRFVTFTGKGELPAWCHRPTWRPAVPRIQRGRKKGRPPVQHVLAELNAQPPASDL